MHREELATGRRAVGNLCVARISRLAEKTGSKTINDEVLLLLRLCGDQGDLIRAKLRREKAMKLAIPPSPGRAYSTNEKASMLAEAAKLRSKNMYPALVVDLNCGLRDKELRELRWRQIDLEAHAAWYIRRFGECKPEWYVFPAGKGQTNDPTRPVTSLKTAWTKVRDKAKVVGRWHDNRHTLVTELAESGAGDEVIMSIAGHVSRASGRPFLFSEGWVLSVLGQSRRKAEHLGSRPTEPVFNPRIFPRARSPRSAVPGARLELPGLSQLIAETGG